MIYCKNQWLKRIGNTQGIKFTFSIGFPSDIVYANGISTFASSTYNWNDVIGRFDNNYLSYYDNKGGETDRTFFLMVIGF